MGELLVYMGFGFVKLTFPSASVKVSLRGAASSLGRKCDKPFAGI